MSEEHVTRIVIAIIMAVPSVLALFKIEIVRRDVNSRMTELLDLTRKSSHAEGVKEGEKIKDK
jgi:hypothetical protein